MYKPSLGTVSILDSCVGANGLAKPAPHTVIYSILECLGFESCTLLAGHQVMSLKPSGDHKGSFVRAKNSSSPNKMLQPSNSWTPNPKFLFHGSFSQMPFVSLLKPPALGSVTNEDSRTHSYLKQLKSWFRKKQWQELGGMQACCLPFALLLLVLKTRCPQKGGVKSWASWKHPEFQDNRTCRFLRDPI